MTNQMHNIKKFKMWLLHTRPFTILYQRHNENKIFLSKIERQKITEMQKLKNFSFYLFYRLIFKLKSFEYFYKTSLFCDNRKYIERQYHRKCGSRKRKFLHPCYVHGDVFCQNMLKEPM